MPAHAFLAIVHFMVNNVRKVSTDEKKAGVILIEPFKMLHDRQNENHMDQFRVVIGLSSSCFC